MVMDLNKTIEDRVNANENRDSVGSSQLNSEYMKREFPLYQAIEEASSYAQRAEQERHDKRRNVPLKDILHIPKTGLLGKTYIPSRTIWKQSPANLQTLNEMVEIHEATHSDWEYETRRTEVKIDTSLMRDYKNRKHHRDYAQKGRDAAY